MGFVFGPVLLSHHHEIEANWIQIIDKTSLPKPIWEQQKEFFMSSKKSPTGPTEWTPKPVYSIALVPYLGVRW